MADSIEDLAHEVHDLEDSPDVTPNHSQADKRETNGIGSGVKRSYDDSNDLLPSEDQVLDRQIRLYGAEAQLKLRSANIVVFGNTGPSSEMMKNIVLGGCNSLTIIDDGDVTAVDLVSNTLTGLKLGVNRAEVCVAKLKTMNPNVKITAINKPVNDFLQNRGEEAIELFSKYNVNVVITNNLDMKSNILLDRLTRSYQDQICFYASWVFGMYAISFSDLMVHHFIHEFIDVKDKTVEKKLITEDGPVTRVLTVKQNIKHIETWSLTYCSLLDAIRTRKEGLPVGRKMNHVYLVFLAVNQFQQEKKVWPQNREEDKVRLNEIMDILFKELEISKVVIKKLDSWADKVFGQIAYVSAMFGGIVSQDIVRGITRKGDPFINFLLFDGVDHRAKTMAIGV